MSPSVPMCATLQNRDVLAVFEDWIVAKAERTPNGHAVNLNDVARLAGVGLGTASRALSGNGSVAPDTLRKVLGAATKLGYRPNPVARSLRSERSRIIAFMLPDLVNEFYTVAADVIHQQLIRAGYQLVITTAGSIEEEAATFRWLMDYKVDGVIHVPIDPNQPLPDGLSVIQLNRVSRSGTAPAVLADDRAGFAAITELLLEAGHTDIAVFTGEEWHSSSATRLAGVRDAVYQRRHVRVRTYPGQFTRESGFASMLALQDDVPEAVIAISPRIASGVIAALNELDRRVPTDLSLVSYDDPEWFSLWQPGMTCVVPPLAAMAESAVRRLLTMMDGTEDVATELLPCEIVVRGSVRQGS